MPTIEMTQIHKQTNLSPPYANSMISAIRCSKTIINCIKTYVKEHNNLFLDEALFNTLALHNNLTITCCPELSSIEYRKDWEISDILSTNLYHPIKSINTQYNYRKLTSSWINVRKNPRLKILKTPAFKLVSLLRKAIWYPW